MLGLGRGSIDLVSQLKRNKIITKNVFAHCLSSKGGGYLSIGDENLLSSPGSWVPMAPRTDRYKKAQVLIKCQLVCVLQNVDFLVTNLIIQNLKYVREQYDRSFFYFNLLSHNCLITP